MYKTNERTNFAYTMRSDGVNLTLTVHSSTKKGQEKRGSKKAVKIKQAILLEISQSQKAKVDS